MIMDQIPMRKPKIGHNVNIGILRRIAADLLDPSLSVLIR